MGQDVAADSTAVRVALWRALHAQVDAAPHVIEDEVGLKLAAPPADWRARLDMHPEFTRLFRASIVARARFIEDLVLDAMARGVAQYVILGSGLDTLAQRRPEIGSRLKIFEVDRPGAQEWKRGRLVELGYGVPEWLRLVPTDFEAGDSWLDRLMAAGFDCAQPAVVASTGVSLYLTREAIMATLRECARLAPGSSLGMTYILPADQADPEERAGREASERGARASGTPFLTFFTGPEMVAMAHDAGFREAEPVPASVLAERYFAGRADGLRPGRSEEFLVARV